MKSTKATDTKSNETPHIRVRVPQTLIDALKRAAKADRRTFSDFVRIALEDRIKRKP